MDPINTQIIIDYDTSDDSNTSNMNHIIDSMMTDDLAAGLRPPTPTLERALTTFVPNRTTNIDRQQRTRNSLENIDLLNTFSRVSISSGKFPNDAILRDYSAFQTWMYTHTNKHAPIDVCQSLIRYILCSPNDYDQDTLFNVRLICTETYQTVGHVDQAYIEYDVAHQIASSLNTFPTASNRYDTSERDRKQKKLDEIAMKLQFQLQFKNNLLERPARRRFNSIDTIFLEHLNMNNPSAEECRFIWRQVVLQSTLNPAIVIPGAQWLLSYANGFPANTLPYANSLYVALNLFLFGYGSRIFQERSDLKVFKMLDDIARYFEENGHQSKQFSSVHKMAHVWGTAAVVHYLASDKHKYLVCASIIRVSFESLGVSFLSSGIESLYILSRKHTPEFFMMMSYDPHIKQISPECINYFRRKLKNRDTFLRYSTEIVDQLVSEVFNIDQTDYSI